MLPLVVSSHQIRRLFDASRKLYSHIMFHRECIIGSLAYIRNCIGQDSTTENNFIFKNMSKQKTYINTESINEVMFKRSMWNITKYWMFNHKPKQTEITSNSTQKVKTKTENCAGRRSKKWKVRTGNYKNNNSHCNITKNCNSNQEWTFSFQQTKHMFKTERRRFTEEFKLHILTLYCMSYNN